MPSLGNSLNGAELETNVGLFRFLLLAKTKTESLAFLDPAANILCK